MELIRKLLGEELMFYTHTPDANRVGEIKDGYRITRVASTTPTALFNGGRADCYEVWGKKLSKEEQ